MLELRLILSKFKYINKELKTKVCGLLWKLLSSLQQCDKLKVYNFIVKELQTISSGNYKEVAEQIIKRAYQQT